MYEGAELTEQLVLLRKHINTGSDGGKDINHIGSNAAHRGHNLRCGAGQQAAQFVDQPLIIIKSRHRFGDVKAEPFLNRQQKGLHVVEVAGKIFKQDDNAGNDLGNHHPAQHENNQNGSRIGNQHREPTHFWVVLEPLMLHRAYNAVQHIGNDNADSKRCQDAEQLIQCSHKQVQMAQQDIKPDAAKDDAQPVQGSVGLFLQPDILAHCISPTHEITAPAAVFIVTLKQSISSGIL